MARMRATSRGNARKPRSRNTPSSEKTPEQRCEGGFPKYRSASQPVHNLPFLTNAQHTRPKREPGGVQRGAELQEGRRDEDGLCPGQESAQPFQHALLTLRPRRPPTTAKYTHV